MSRHLLTQSTSSSSHEHYLKNVGVFFLALIAGSMLYFSKNYKREITYDIQIPLFIEISLFDKTFMTQLEEKKELIPYVVSHLEKEVTLFNKRVSPVYKSLNSDFVLTFFVDQEKNAHLALFKYADHISGLELVSHHLVKKYDEEKVELAFGRLTYLNQQEFNIKTLKLAQDIDFDSFK